MGKLESNGTRPLGGRSAEAPGWTQRRGPCRPGTAGGKASPEERKRLGTPGRYQPDVAAQQEGLILKTCVLGTAWSIPGGAALRSVMSDPL